jgi:histidinol phosphatase-like PHP family hydrolase
MKITSDWHIHSDNSCDVACMRVSDLVSGAAAAGIEDFGLTDHLHTPYNLPDVAASREEFLSVRPSQRFHFGVEVSCVSQWELDEIAAGGHADPVYGLRKGGPPGATPAIGLTAMDIERLGIEYVVGGTHWPMYVPLERQGVIADYHRQNMFLATHPLVNIVAHPWWWMGHWADSAGRFTAEPWLDDFGVIPRSLHDEFAAAVKEHGKAVEINLAAMLLNNNYPDSFKAQYLEYLAWLKGRGVALSIGSDCHSRLYDINFERSAAMLESVGFRDGDFWRLPPRRTAQTL